MINDGIKFSNGNLFNKRNSIEFQKYPVLSNTASAIRSAIARRVSYLSNFAALPLIFLPSLSVTAMTYARKIDTYSSSFSVSNPPDTWPPPRGI